MIPAAPAVPAADTAGRLEGALAKVAFTVLADTAFGDSVVAVGSAKQLGAWEPSAGLRLRTAPGSYPRWSGEVQVSASKSDGEDMEFKFVLLRADGSIHWEAGPNRRLCGCWPAAPGPGPVALGPPRGPPPPVPRFGDMAMGGAQVVAADDGRGWQREDSMASTCDPIEDDSPGSRCASSLLLAGEPILEEVEEEAASAASPGALCLWAGAHRLPKSSGSCEDAYFFNCRGAGVADGVGQMADYAKYGVDAAAYAHELMEFSARALLENGSEAESPLQRAARAVTTAERTASKYGASTITVLALEGAAAGISNLGDSGFILMRPKPWGMEVVDKSREQSHSWNCPYQLTRVPRALAHCSRGRRLDTAADADGYTVAVQPGDLLLLFTDGLTDNLHSAEITRIVDETLKATLGEVDASSESEATSPGGGVPAVPPATVAEALVRAAEERSHDEVADTPFAQNARRHNEDMPGGKVDDVTVVAAWVVAEGAVGMQQASAPGTIVLGSLQDAAGSRVLEV